LLREFLDPRKAPIRRRLHRSYDQSDLRHRRHHFDELVLQFKEQAQGLIDGGADYLLLETCQDTRNIKAATLGIEQAIQACGVRIPTAVSGTIEPMGTMLAGQTAEALVTSLLHLDLLYIGLNCATGPEFMTDPIRSLSELSPFRIACVPNAGLPDENGCYLETPEMLSRVLDRFIAKGWINLVGGCCGTHEGHIEHLTKLVQGKKTASPHPQSQILALRRRLPGNHG